MNVFECVEKITRKGKKVLCSKVQKKNNGLHDSN